MYFHPMLLFMYMCIDSADLNIDLLLQASTHIYFRSVHIMGTIKFCEPKCYGNSTYFYLVTITNTTDVTTIDTVINFIPSCHYPV